MATGNDLLVIAAPHEGEQYILGSFAPKNNSQWRGPWDCAEFVSWCVFQAGGMLYGCEVNTARHPRAGARTPIRDTGSETQALWEEESPSQRQRERPERRF